MNNQLIHIERIKTTMKNASDSHKLPEFYRDDLSLDFDSLERFSGTKLIWLLRSCGTVLVPARLGVDPGYITHWLWGSHGQKIVPFIVDPQAGSVEMITFEEAEQLIMQPPCSLSSGMSSMELAEAVNGVLERGCEQRIWGVFNSPVSVSSIGSWSEWQSYFSNTGNRLMADFIGKAIRFANNKPSASA